MRGLLALTLVRDCNRDGDGDEWGWGLGKRWRHGDRDGGRDRGGEGKGNGERPGRKDGFGGKNGGGERGRRWDGGGGGMHWEDDQRRKAVGDMPTTQGAVGAGVLLLVETWEREEEGERVMVVLG